MEGNSEYVAHIRKSDGREQTVAEHNNGVAKIAHDIGNQYGIGNLSIFTGRHHDDGKNTQEYLSYLKAAADGESVVRGSVIHSTYGAMLANNLASTTNTTERLSAEMVRTAIMSHHGLRDCLTSDGRCSFHAAIKHISDSYSAVEQIVYKYYGKDVIESEFQKACRDAKMMRAKIKEFDSVKQGYGSSHFYLAMYIRLLTSIIIDADRTDTACFEDRIELKSLPTCQTRKNMWNLYLDHCEAKIRLFQYDKYPSVLDQFRAEISKSCSAFDGGSNGVFRLVVPCGAGKTLSALRYALQTAAHYGKKHIFYIAPFNSVLEQNASEIATYIGNDDAVLRHHSNVIFDSDDSEVEKRYKLLTENWSQSPVIATSAVQFLDTLFNSKTSCVRRMQSLGDSIIIVDEIQALPIKVLKLFNGAMNFLAQFCGSAIVLCSATQPLLDKLNDYRIIPPKSLIHDDGRFDEVFKRVEIVDYTKGNGFSIDETANFILEQAKNTHSILAIVNTKPVARKVAACIQKFVKNSNAYRLFHLSTNMCPAHRIVVLKEMRSCLQDKGNSQKIICISTTLIEAGVDVSFERVIRSLTGLDSIIQAAGRCNRNRETVCGIVSIIYIRDESIGGLDYIQRAQEVTREVLHNIQTNPQQYPGGALSKAAMNEFYTKYYHPMQKEMAFPLKDDPEHTIIDLLTTNPSGSKQNKNANTILLKQAFKEAGDAFAVIEDIGKQDVIVEYNDDALIHIKKMLSTRLISDKKKELRYLQQYTVQLSKYIMQKIGTGVRFDEDAGVFILSRVYYHNEFGVSDDPRVLIL
ncbi:MAG: CRISPR-associated helicase Cas3' [Clostridiaceae bacterium]|nr:CRISPR-associated helicase Cas3' [Clostridiaceae bacterium]